MHLSGPLLQITQALFFPQSCVLCDRWVCNRDFSPLCRSCLTGLEKLSACCATCGMALPGRLTESGPAGMCSRCTSSPPLFEFALAYGPYSGSLRRLIHAYKFGGRRRLALPLAGLVGQAYITADYPFQPRSVVAVPSHPSRLRERGFDHAALLAARAAGLLHLPYTRPVRRVRATAPQFGLDIEQRRRNLEGAFRVTQATPGDVLLVDDIFTTGTTAAAVARLLRNEGGADRVGVLTIARVALLYSS